VNPMPAMRRFDRVTAVTESRFPAYNRYRIAFLFDAFS
jgi:hypothetical protein